MAYINLCRWPTPLNPWFRASPTLAEKLGLVIGPTSQGSVSDAHLTTAGELLFGDTGIWPQIERPPRSLREVGCWMAIEEGWSAKSWIEATSQEVRLYNPAPLPPSVCKVLARYFALAGLVNHRTAQAFLSGLHTHRRERVTSDPTPVTHMRSQDGEASIPVPRPPFHPFVRWTLA